MEKKNSEKSLHQRYINITNTTFVLMAKTFALTAVLITMQDQEPFVTVAFLRGLIKSRQGIKHMVRPMVSCRAFLIFIFSP